MHVIDWAICATLITVMVVVALMFRRFGTSVSGFLAANRCAGRYLLCVASNMAATGIITLVWLFQLHYDSGWTSIWWSFMEYPVMIVLALTGWVIYRFRETRALTLAQFFEERYSKRFRVFCGVVAFVSGVINYAIFPAVSAHFFMGLCGFPTHFEALGFTWNTYQVIMGMLLSMALFFVFVGGQIVIMAVDFLQGVFCNVAFLVIIGFCIITFGWGRISETMLEQVWHGQRVTWQLDAKASGGPTANWAVLVRDGMLGPDAQFVSAQMLDDGTTRMVVSGRPNVPQDSRFQFGAPVPLLDGKEAAASAAPHEERSMAHPFKIKNEDNFNVYYWMISAFILFYAAKAWQGGQGFNASALNPHEAKMAQILSGWKFRVLMLVALVVPVCVKVFLHHPDYAQGAQVVNDHLGTIGSVLGAEAAPQTVDAFTAQMRAPLALAQILPVGLLGLMAAAMLGAYLSVDNSYLHSWGSIVVQDVVLPFRKKPLSQRQHLWLLRGAILSVAVFAFVAGVFYRPGEYIANFAALTSSVFVAGAGVCIIGGLYWKRGTTAAAWTAMIAGIVTAAVAIAAKEPALVPTAFLERWAAEWWCDPARLLLYLRESSKLSGQVLGFFAMTLSVVLYVVISVVQGRKFNLDRLLHRGAYHDAGSSGARSTEGGGPAPTVMERLGFTREFTGTDKWVTWVTIAWPLLWTLAFIVFTAFNLAVHVSSRAWMDFWRWWTVSIFVLGIVIMVWFSVGGFRDLRDMYRRLKQYKPDVHDDGTVES